MIRQGGFLIVTVSVGLDDSWMVPRVGWSMRTRTESRIAVHATGQGVGGVYDEKCKFHYRGIAARRFMTVSGAAAAY